MCACLLLFCSAAPPAKPWERAGAVTTSAPGAPKPWEQAGAATVTDTSTSALSRPAERPWERGPGQTSTALASTSAPGSTSLYTSSYNRPGMYGSTYGSVSALPTVMGGCEAGCEACRGQAGTAQSTAGAAALARQGRSLPGAGSISGAGKAHSDEHIQPAFAAPQHIAARQEAEV